LLKQQRAVGMVLPFCPMGKLPFGLCAAVSGQGKWRLSCGEDHSWHGMDSPESGERFHHPESARSALSGAFPGPENGGSTASGCFPETEWVHRNPARVFPHRNVFARLWVVLFPVVKMVVQLLADVFRARNGFAGIRPGLSLSGKYSPRVG